MRSFTLLLAGVLALCGTLPAASRRTRFPILGGSLGQTMRIAITADGRAGCTAVAGFRNSLGQPPEPDKTLMLAPGQTGFVDLSLNRLAPRIGQRVEVRPFVQVAAGQCDGSVEVFEVSPAAPRPRCDCSPVCSAAGAGHAWPASPAGPGFSRPGRRARPNGAPGRGALPEHARDAWPRSQPPEPECQAVLGFTDANGNAVGPQKRIELAPGQFDFVDLDPAKLPGPAGGRVTIRPVLLSAGGSLASSGIGSGVRATRRLDQRGRAGQVRKRAKPRRADSAFCEFYRILPASL